MSQPVFVVQCPHSGGEHNPRKLGRMEWNTGPHKRKFIRSRGRDLDRHDDEREADLVFWGEWEPCAVPLFDQAASRSYSRVSPPSTGRLTIRPAAAGLARGCSRGTWSSSA